MGGLSYDRNFYPRSPCGERRVTVLGIQHRTGISIHALLAESDAPAAMLFTFLSLFLSTLSLRRATRVSQGDKFQSDNFYPRSPCGERPPRGGFCYLDNIISIHALLAESDHISKARCKRINRFLSTLSLRRATSRAANCQHRSHISIHALLAESDRTATNRRPIFFISIHALLAESDPLR